MIVAVIAAAAAVGASSAWAAARIEGHGRFEKIKGQLQMGYVELYESNLFITPPSPFMVGPSRRLGASCTEGGVCSERIITYDGCYCKDNMPAGTYSLLLNQPDFFVAPKVLPDVVVPASGSVTAHVEIPIDYSTFYKNDWTSSSQSPWYQTFVATGKAIRGIAFSYAGPSPSSIAAAILEDNGSPDVRNWRFVAERTDPGVGDITDNWVRFRSVEAPTTPGKRYAVRLTAHGGTIQPYKRNKDPNSYAGGRAYDSGGVPQNFDLNIVVFSDNDGTLVTMNKRTAGIGDLQDGNFSTRWGHSFTANGTSLAGVDVWAAGAESKWELDFTWKVYEGAGPNGPTGPQIGPTRITRAAFFGFGAGLHGVSYNPGEVPLVKGNKYFIEFTIFNPPPQSNGFNPYVMTDDSYDGGNGYCWWYGSWENRPSVDLAMTIIEYAPPGPLLKVDPEVIDRTVLVGNNPSPDTVTVKNVGIDVLHWNIEEGSDWFDVAPTRGSCTTETDAITITYDTVGRPLGFDSEQITVDSTDAVNGPKTVTVNLTIRSVPPDFDEDLDVDMDDYALLQACYSGPGVPQMEPACAEARLDEDEDVDLQDLEVLRNCISGKDVPADTSCVP